MRLGKVTFARLVVKQSCLQKARTRCSSCLPNHNHVREIKIKNSSSNQFLKFYPPAKSRIVWLLGVGCVEEKEEVGEEEKEEVEEGKEVEDCLRGSSQVARPNQTNT